MITAGSETYTVCRDKDGQLYVKGYEKLPVQTSLFDSLETELTKDRRHAGDQILRKRCGLRLG